MGSTPDIATIATMEVIDLNDQDLIDDCSEYINVSGTERQLFESRPLQPALEETFNDQDIISDKLVSRSIPSVSSTKKILENTRLEQRVPDSVTFKTASRREAHTESIEQRLSRIKCELEEIRKLQETVSDSESLQDVHYLEELHSQLLSVSQARLSNVKKRLPQQNTNVVLPNITIDESGAQRLLVLDQKIHELERIIGPPGNDEKSLITRLESLFRQVKLLNNDNERLGQFHERIIKINKFYEDSLVGRRSKVDPKLYDAMLERMTPHEMKVNELYKYHGLLEAYAPILPRLLDRIKYLSGINDSVGETYELARTLNVSMSDLQSQANKWEELLAQLENKLDQQSLDMERNVNYVDKKLSSLEAKD